MTTRTIERHRRYVIEAQRQAASAYVWMRSRADWGSVTARREIKDDQAYVARQYEKAREMMWDVEYFEWVEAGEPPIARVHHDNLL